MVKFVGERSGVRALLESKDPIWRMRYQNVTTVCNTLFRKETLFMIGKTFFNFLVKLGSKLVRFLTCIYYFEEGSVLGDKRQEYEQKEC